MSYRQEIYKRDLCMCVSACSILGMNLFGCKFCEKVANNTNISRVCKRKNFDSLLWALITVFQVIAIYQQRTVDYLS